MGTSHVRPSGLGDYTSVALWAADGARAPGDIAECDEAGTQTAAISIPGLANLTVRATVAGVVLSHGTTAITMSINSAATNFVCEGVTILQTGSTKQAVSFGAGTTATFTNCTIQGIGYAVSTAAVVPGAIVFDHCTIVATAGTAVRIAQALNLTIQDCVLQGGYCGIYTNTIGGAIRRTKIHTGLYVWAAPGGTVYMNTLVLEDIEATVSDTVTGATNVWDFDRSTIPAGQTVTLYHVTLVGTTAWTLAHHIGLRSFRYAGSGTGALIARNGIITGFATGLLVQNTAWQQDYFDLWGNGANGSGTRYVPGAHDISADPRFQDAGAGDYRLGAGSPCLGAGIDVGVTTSLDGIAFDAPPPMGAHAAADTTPPNVIGATSPGRWTAIVTFSEAVYGADLETAAAWGITALDGGTVPAIESVVANPAHTVATVTTTLLRSEGQYRITAPATIADGAGNLIGIRTGDLVAPRSFGLANVSVVGPNLIRVVFDNPFLPTSIFNPVGWSITPMSPISPLPVITGVTIDSATEVLLDVVPGVVGTAGYRIATSTATGTSGEPCYPASILLSTGASIEDAPIRPPSEDFIGVPVLTDVATCRIYPMLQEGLRDVDQRAGSAFLERFLEGPEAIWSAIQQKIARLPYLIDPARCPAEALDLLRAGVAFGAGSGTPDAIASRLTTADLRKLIQIAVPYWRKRGTRSALADMIRVFASGVYPAIDDWFFVRWLVDDVLLGTEGGPGSDPWLLYDPIGTVPGGYMDGAEFETAIRVADLGSLDRTVVEDLCGLARVPSERMEIAYVDFLDTFRGGTCGLWTSTPGALGAASWRAGVAGDPAILPGLIFPAGAAERIAAPRSGGWTNIVASVIFDWSAAHLTTIRFFWQDALNYYFADFASATGTVRIGKVVAGATTVLATGTADLSVPAARGVRVEALTSAAGNQIRVYVDESIAVESTGDTAFVEGTIEFMSGPASDPGALAICRVEVYETPLDVTYLGPR